MILHFPNALWRHRELWWKLTEREILGRYRGSLLGMAWSFLNPLAMLAVYTFVFSKIFQTRWDTLESAGPLGFAINLFAGLIVFNLFAECINKAPELILGNPNYVTKIVFPLEVLAAASVATCVFHALISLLILLIFQLTTWHAAPATLLWLPFVWMPLIGMCLALSWLLSALGVFLRDIGQVAGVMVNMLMFLSAIFYPVSALPVKWLPFLRLNPILILVEQTRRVVVAGEAPNSWFLLGGMAFAIAFCELSYRAFQRVRHGFADVL